MLRRSLIFVVCILGLLALALAALPWWWGAALHAVGTPRGLSFGAYERHGYGAWELRDVTWTHERVEVQFAQVRLPHPLHWLARGARTEAVRAEKVRVTLLPADGPATEPGVIGWTGLWNQVHRLEPRVRRWLPSVEVHNWTLEGPTGPWGGERVDWHAAEARLTWTGLSWREWQAAGGVTWAAPGSVTGEVRVPDYGEVRLAVDRDGAALDGWWWNQPWTAAASWADDGWRPLTAEARAEGWELPGSRVGLGGRYDTVRGRAAVSWTPERQTAHLEVTGEPVAESNLPALAIVVAATGEGSRWRVEQLQAEGPGLWAELSAPVEWDWVERAVPAAAEFAWRADVGELSAGVWQGESAGRLRWHATGGADADWLTGEASAAQVSWGDWPAMSARTRFAVRDFDVSIEDLEVTTTDGSEVTGYGLWRGVERELAEAELQGLVTRRWLARWLPEDVAFDEVAVELRAAGIWPALQHEGRLELTDLGWRDLQPTAVTANWTGSHVREYEGTARAKTAAAWIELQGAWRTDHLVLDAGSWVREAGGTMQLDETTGRRLTLASGDLAWVGEGTAWSATWQMGESVRWAATGLTHDWVEDWWRLPGPAWTLSEADIEAAVVAGYWQGRGALVAAIDLGEERAAQVGLRLAFDEHGLQIERGEVTEDGQAIVSFTGQVPWRLSPATGWDWAREGPLRLSLRSERHPAFWQRLDDTLGVRIREPEVRAELSGSWERPLGAINLSMAELALDEARWDQRWPRLTSVRARLAGTAAGLELQEASGEVLGQAVRADGRLPWGDNRLARLGRAPWAYLMEAGEGRIEILDAELAAWAPLAPTILAPTGRLHLELMVRPGGELDGVLDLRDAALRPLGPLGALQDINTRLRLRGREVTIDTLAARVGGRPVTLAGSAEWAAGEAPRFDLTLAGDNLPLVRQTGLLVRGGLRLQVKTDPVGVTRLSGRATLNDGLFLMDLGDLRAMGGGRGNTAARRPPYFSIEALPMADWQVDLTVTGDRFLRLATPVLTGWASADFRLSGTLRQPQAVGALSLDAGWIRLPFANFRITEGEVRLPVNDPFVPQLDLQGEARRMGYDLRLELSGPAQDPHLQFHSSPMLPAEEVFLLVMAGEAPRDEVSYSASQRAARLGTYLGMNLYQQFTGRQTDEDRLQVTTGERVSREGRETYRVEYRLNQKWGVEGEYDEFDAFNVGLRRRLFERRPTEDDDE